jgi:glyoxylase-like metal-dependent hydrolase (beta-lactamase superfamily II)
MNVNFEFNSKINQLGDVIQIKIDVPFDVKYVYTYLLKLEDSYFLFDAGLNMGNGHKKFFSCLEELDITPKKISHCLVSHNHLDHIGMVKKLKRKNPDLKIMMHDITNETMKWETNRDNLNQLKETTENVAKEVIQYGFSEEQGERLIKYFLTWPQLKKYYPPDIILHDNYEFEIENGKFKVIWTPGHALGHTCLFEKNRKYLFSGDHILSRITPHIGVFIINPMIKEKYSEYNFHNILKLYLNSLKRIDQLKPEIIFPAHQELIYSPEKRIKQIQEHHQRRLKEIYKLIENKPMSPVSIAKQHFGDLDDINSFLALSEVLAHLFYLEEQEKVKKISEDNITKYYALN